MANFREIDYISYLRNQPDETLLTPENIKTDKLWQILDIGGDEPDLLD